MPKEKSAFTALNPPEETPFYYARVPTKLLKRVEKARLARKHNKVSATITMMELYLRFPIEPAIP